MSGRPIEILEVRNSSEWRAWLDSHHDSKDEIWLAFFKRRTGISAVEYDDAVKEALCYGWIDSLIRRIDDDRYARKFTPRKKKSKWSTANRRRYAELKSSGKLEKAGLKRPPDRRSGDAPKSSASRVPPYIEKGIKTNTDAWKYFENLAPSHRRAYIGWIENAKKEETRQKRLRKAITMLSSGKKPGMLLGN